jgi:formylglycine-generating enzyme required for sulfatase activity
VHEKTGLTFVLIPPGSLTMGSPKDDEHRDDDEPFRSVSIQRPFVLCETECTQDAWDRLGGENHRRATGGSLPIVVVQQRESVKYPVFYRIRDCADALEELRGEGETTATLSSHVLRMYLVDHFVMNSESLGPHYDSL